MNEIGQLGFIGRWLVKSIHEAKQSVFFTKKTVDNRLLAKKKTMTIGNLQRNKN